MAITENTRSTVLPDVPAVSETLPGFEMGSWFGIFAPAGLPTDIRDRLNKEIVSILKEPEMSAKLQAAGIDVVASSPEAFAAVQKAEIAARKKILEQADLKAE